MRTGTTVVKQDTIQSNGINFNCTKIPSERSSTARQNKGISQCHDDFQNSSRQLVFKAKV